MRTLMFCLVLILGCAGLTLGTSPDNGYTLPEPPYTLEITRNPYSEINENTVKVFVLSSGADSPRPVTLKQNSRGIWKVSVESLILGIREPVTADPVDDI